MLINPNNVMFDNSVVNNNDGILLHSNEPCYVLDTDDLLVEEVSYKYLQECMKSMSVHIENAGLRNGEIWTHVGGWQLSTIYLKESIHTKDNLVWITNRDTIIVNNKSYHICFVQESNSFILKVNNFDIAKFKLDYLTYRRGISYLFRIKDFVIVRVGVFADFVTYKGYFTVAIDLSGAIRGVSASKSINTKIEIGGNDEVLMSKLDALLRRY